MSKIVSAELIQNLEEIARIKESLPARSRRWCSELGLFVQMREAAGMARLQAGGKFRSRINLWRDSSTASWQIKKYRPGEWETLVEPTLKLAKWLGPRGAVTELVKDDFEYAIKASHNTPRLELPERIDSIPDNSILGRILGSFSQSPRDWDDTKAQDVERGLLRYLEVNPRHAAAWQALTRVYLLQGRCEEFLTAINEAIKITPFETEFRWDAALIYITAIKNAVEPGLQLGLLGQAMRDCSLDALQCSYEEARATCINHLRMILESMRPDSKRYKEEARWMIDWCMKNPAHKPDQSKEQDTPNKEELQFCGTVAANIIRRLQISGDSPLDFRMAIYLTATCLLMGWVMANRYPDKAKLVLIKERMAIPTDTMDYNMRIMSEKVAGLKGLQDDEALLYVIESEVKGKLAHSRSLSEMNQFIHSVEGEVKDNENLLRIAVMRLTPNAAPTQFEDMPVSVDVPTVFETLFGALKDGIAYGLFAPNESIPEAISHEVAHYGIKEPFDVEESLETAIQGYEEVLGVIR